MQVKWHNKMSSVRNLNGGGAQGALFGIWEYLAQSNKNADCVEPENRFKFVDDLSTLEILNLLIIGLASINPKVSVPSDMPFHNQFIPGEHLKSQAYLNHINEWSKNQKMILNEKKTKAMVFNFTDNYQFTTKLSLNNSNLELVDKAKLLGVKLSNDLKWDDNTEELVKRAYVRMEILRKLSSYSPTIEDMKHIYILYIRSVLEQSCVVWHSALTEENSDTLERVQKCALKLILGNKYENYEKALETLNLEKLNERRERLCLVFAKKCLQNEKTADMFPKNKNKSNMETRNSEEFKVNHANTDRYKYSAIPHMQRLLNNDAKTRTRRPG